MINLEPKHQKQKKQKDPQKNKDLATGLEVRVVVETSFFFAFLFYND